MRFALRPPPIDLHHSYGRPCAACDWSDAWKRTKTALYVALAVVNCTTLAYLLVTR